MLALGIDPGTANTGYGIVRSDRPGLVSLVECGVIRTRPRDPLAARLAEIYDGVTQLIARHRPDALSVEDVFYSRNVRTTVVLGHARGVILLAGPFEPEGTGALVVLNVQTTEEAHAIYVNDPWKDQGILFVADAKEWTIFLNAHEQAGR